MVEPTSLELTADLIAWSRGEPYPDRSEHPVWRRVPDPRVLPSDRDPGTARYRAVMVIGPK